MTMGSINRVLKSMHPLSAELFQLVENGCSWYTSVFTPMERNPHKESESSHTVRRIKIWKKKSNIVYKFVIRFFLFEGKCDNIA